MTLFIKPHTVRIILAAFCLLISLNPVTARGQEESDEETLDLFNAWQQASSTASRAPKPLSQTPENITIITASDIEALNAHTLADVLSTIPDIQIQNLGGPGSAAYTFIQSANFTHTLIQLDGAPLNKIGSSSDIGMVPARIIERIEIVKGSASAAWGPALGGVINVITKTPEKRLVGGTATASLGSSTTADTSLELTGTSGRFGYYLSTGYLGSNGLLPGRPLHSNNNYAKLTYDLPDNGQIWATVNHTRVRQGENFDIPVLDFKESSDQNYLDTTLGIRRQLTEQLSFEVTGFYTHRNRYDNSDLISTPLALDYHKFTDRVGGVNTKLIWKLDNHLLVGGVEYIHENLTNHVTESISAPELNGTTTKWYQNRTGIYLNDTITAGQLTLVPGFRFDAVKDGDHFNPSLGATWQLSDNNLLRAYTARGYGYTNSASGLWNTEKIWTTQVGMESTAVPYLWQKLTLFRNRIGNALDLRNIDTATPENRTALGVEYEVRTTPVFNTSVGAGYTFTDLTRSTDGSQVKSFARHTVKILLRYDDQTYRAALTGNHTYWNHVEGYNGSYYGVLWDLHLGAKVWKHENNSVELFLSGRNLFNGKQYPDETQPNTGRWFEGGVRLRF